MTGREVDEHALRALVDELAAGWNAGDGALFADPFAVDADYTAVTGLHVRGRDLIGRGHDELFGSVFRGTRITLSVDDIRFVRPDVAVVHTSNALAGPDGQPVPGNETSAAMLVACREDGRWSVTAFHNMRPQARPAAGPVEQALAG